MKLNFESKEELAVFIASEVIDTSEAMEIMGCTRQNIADQVKRGKLIPIKEMKRDRLFFKSDVKQRKKEAEMYFKNK